MRYEIIDSHRKMNINRREELNNFFQNVKNVSREKAWEHVDFCDWYEKEFAVKWMEAIAFESGKVVGYLMCLRHPSCTEEWFIGDVYVLEEYRGRNIATKLYEKTIDAVQDYSAAQRIISSVNRDNVKSIKLHEKVGFVNTGKTCEFPNLYFDKNEVMFQFDILEGYPISEVESGVEQLLPLWIEYKKSIGQVDSPDKLKKELYVLLIKAVEKGVYECEAIFSGYKLVGFSYWNDKEEVEYIRENY